MGSCCQYAAFTTLEGILCAQESLWQGCVLEFGKAREGWLEKVLEWETRHSTSCSRSELPGWEVDQEADQTCSLHIPPAHVGGKGNALLQRGHFGSVAVSVVLNDL